MSLYLHVPFCRQACPYCDFHFSLNLKKKEEMVRSMLLEMEAWASRQRFPQMQSVYFGGGTPSILGPEAIDLLLNRAKQLFDLAPDAEITLEANPDDLIIHTPEQWKKLGINRFSIGVQSFSDKFLRRLNRSHSAEQAKNAIALAAAAGFEKCSLDLMFGLPGQTLQDWKQDLEQALTLPVDHLSVYGLTIEPKTVFHRKMRQGDLDIPGDEESADFFKTAHHTLQNAGFEHYEVSNYAKPEHRSRHNCNYWSGANYLGIGPSAHSYLDGTRYHNPASNGMYMQQVQRAKMPAQKESINREEAWNEMLMTALRQKEGLDKEKVSTLFGTDAWETLQRQLHTFPSEWFVSYEPIALSCEGWLLMDQLLVALFRTK